MSLIRRTHTSTPDNAHNRTCIPRDDATDDFRLNCIFLNYLQGILQPLQGQNQGFFSHQSPVPIKLHEGDTDYDSLLIRGAGPYQNPPGFIQFTIHAHKSNHFYIYAKAKVLDGYVDGETIAVKKLRIRIRRREGTERRWANTDFDTVLSMLRWKCKAKYDSFGRERPLANRRALRRLAPWDRYVDL